jgi:hypothetical protein
MAAGNTYVAIATQTLGSAVSSVTFSSIPGTYTDLVLVVSSTTSVDSASTRIRYNNDSSTLYSRTRLEGVGGSALSGRNTDITSIEIESNIGTDSVIPSVFIFQIMNYSNTTTNKTTLIRQNGFYTGAEGTSVQVGLYRSTSAINRIDILETANNFNIGSTFSLYGIAAA